MKTDGSPDHIHKNDEKPTYDAKKDESILKMHIQYFSKRYGECDSRSMSLAGLLAIILSLINIASRWGSELPRWNSYLLIISSFLLLAGLVVTMLSIHPLTDRGRLQNIKYDLKRLEEGHQLRTKGLPYLDYFPDIYKGSSRIEVLQNTASLYQSMVIRKSVLFVISLYLMISAIILMFISIVGLLV
jgi:hypothetical protein